MFISYCSILESLILLKGYKDKSWLWTFISEPLSFVNNCYQRCSINTAWRGVVTSLVWLLLLHCCLTVTLLQPRSPGKGSHEALSSSVWPVVMYISIVFIINTLSPQWAAPFSRLAPEWKKEASRQCGCICFSSGLALDWTMIRLTIWDPVFTSQKWWFVAQTCKPNKHFSP